LRKPGSRFARARMVSLKSRVKAMCSPFCPFSLLVVLPSRQSRVDVLLLAFFRSTTDEDYQPLAVFTEVDTVAWAEIDSVFVNTGTNAFDVGEIALLKCGLELTTP
jgi:hypothetical protein